MASETVEIRDLLSSTGSELYKQIGIYLADLEFTSDILDDEDSEFADLFAEDIDCKRIGLPTTSDDKEHIKQFVISRAQDIITQYTSSKSRVILSKALLLKNELLSQNSDVYKKLGVLLFQFQVNCDDITIVDHLKAFLTKADLTRMGLKNAAKQKLAFRKVLRIINDLQKKQPQMDIIPNEQKTIENTENINNNGTKPKAEDPNDILKRMLSAGSVSAESFWSHFFSEQKTVKIDALRDSIRIIMELNTANDIRISSAYIESIVLSIKCVDSSSSSDTISHRALRGYAESFNESDIMESFEHTQNEFETLYEADQSKNFKHIQMSNFEETLFQIIIYRRLLSSNFESEIWKYLIIDKFISYLAMIMKLANKFKKTNNNECGLKLLSEEIFSNDNRMSSLCSNHKSSFYSLSQSQLLYILKLDALALSEDKLFSAIKAWCDKKLKQKKDNIYRKMAVFVPFIRFPLMSFSFLFCEILPIKDELFSNSDDFLYILMYKINTTLLDTNDKTDISKKLCCDYALRTYQSRQSDDTSMSARLMKLTAENQVLLQNNEILNQKNRKLKSKVSRLKDKGNGDGNAGTDEPGERPAGRKARQRSVTNSFAPQQHINAVHAKKISMTAGKRHSHTDDDPLLEGQKHLKQVSKSVINSVQGLEMGTSTVKFLVPFADITTPESEDIYAQMRKKMTDRTRGRLSAHQRKKEKEEQEEQMKIQRKRELEETKRRLREEAKKMKRKRKPKKRSKGLETPETQTHPKNSTFVVKEDMEDNDEQDIIETMQKEDEEDDEEEEEDKEEEDDKEEEEEEEDEEDSNDEPIPDEEENREEAQQQEQHVLDAIDYGLKPKEVEQEDEDEDDDKGVYELVENNYGYPQVHDAMKGYYVNKGTECTNPTHLILYSKKQGIPGVSFANANKYYKARKNDANVVGIGVEIAAQKQVHNDEDEDNGNDDDSDASGHSNENNIEQSPPITITQSHTEPHRTIPNPRDDDDDGDIKQQIQDTLSTNHDKNRRKSAPKLDGKSKKKKKKLLIAAEMLGKLQKKTGYYRFETPLYILPLNVAERKKMKDEKRMIAEMGINLGYKVQLHRGNMKGTIKFIGRVHFTFGVVIGLEIAGNGNGKHCGEMDKIKYFDSKRNGGLFVRAECIDKILDKKKLKSLKKYKEMDEITAQRFKRILNEQDEDEEEDDEEIDLSQLSRKEKNRLERFHLEIGDVVEVDKGRKGILHYCGEVHWTDNIMFGVQYVDKAVGKYNGTYGDVEYFKCPEKRGMFFTSDKIRKKSAYSVLNEW